MTDALSYLGSYPLFLGVETETWSIADFILAAQNAQALGCTSLIVKIADGGNVWGTNTGGWNHIISAIQSTGMKAIPYTYCYGNEYGAIATEANILASAMRTCGIVIADMESEYNNQSMWANYITGVMKAVPGIFGVTTWANPSEQQWTGVLKALAPAVNFFMPQVYSDYLADRYVNEYSSYGIPYYPVLNLGIEFGPNDVLSIANSSKADVIAFWEYQAAHSNYAATVKAITNRGAANVNVPSGWKYDAAKKILTAPNGTQVTDGFCQWVLGKNWDPGNIPLMGAIGMTQVEMGNPSLGGGTVQPFRKTVLVWTSKTGVYEMWTGQEYVALYRYIQDLLNQQKGGVNQEQLTVIENALTRITAAINDIGVAAKSL